MSLENHVSQKQVKSVISDALPGNHQSYCRLVKEQEPRAVHTSPSRGDQNPTPLNNSVTIRTDDDGSLDEASSSSPSRIRQCTGTCGQPIPAKRLAARSSARMCVPCQEAAGDVPRLLRFDEHGVDGARLETFFIADSDPRVSRYMKRMNTAVVDDVFFEIAVGDDSFLSREGDSVLDIARPLASEFDDEDEPSVESLLLAA